MHFSYTYIRVYVYETKYTRLIRSYLLRFSLKLTARTQIHYNAELSFYLLEYIHGARGEKIHGNLMGLLS